MARGRTVLDPRGDIEEGAAGFYKRGEYDRAAAAFRLLVECFDRYSEGYNYLGLIALDQGQLEEATRYFEKTAEVGRRLFPKRMPKKRFWTELSTRPYRAQESRSGFESGREIR